MIPSGAKNAVGSFLIALLIPFNFYPGVGIIIAM